MSKVRKYNLDKLDKSYTRFECFVYSLGGVSLRLHLVAEIVDGQLDFSYYRRGSMPAVELIAELNMFYNKSVKILQGMSLSDIEKFGYELF